MFRSVEMDAMTMWNTRIDTILQLFSVLHELEIRLGMPTGYEHKSRQPRRLPDSLRWDLGLPPAERPRHWTDYK
jgi:hypothetical protein